MVELMVVAVTEAMVAEAMVAEVMVAEVTEAIVAEVMLAVVTEAMVAEVMLAVVTEAMGAAVAKAPSSSKHSAGHQFLTECACTMPATLSLQQTYQLNYHSRPIPRCLH